MTVQYVNGQPTGCTKVVVSTQHNEKSRNGKKYTPGLIKEMISTAVETALPKGWMPKKPSDFLVNPTGNFVVGGPDGDCGLTGRKIIVDTYGGWGRHGGGAFSGKDPSKVDRSSAYFCRYVAKQVVASGIAKKAEIQVGYAIGMAQPVSVKVDTFGTGDERAAAEFVKAFDFRPRAIINHFDLLRPIYRSTTNYGHFGRPGLPWEVVEKAAAVAK